MKNLFVLAMATLFLGACREPHDGEMKTGLLANLVSITANEDKGIKEVLSIYGGKCEYTIGVSTSSEAGKKKYFRLEVSQSEFIESQAEIAQI